MSIDLLYLMPKYVKIEFEFLLLNISTVAMLISRKNIYLDCYLFCYYNHIRETCFKEIWWNKKIKWIDENKAVLSMT